MNDEQTNVSPEAAAPAGRKPGSARGTAFKVAALLLPPLCLVAGAACWLHAPRDGDTARTPPASTEPEVPLGTERGLFHGWPTPDFVLVLSAQQHGYLLPCGCSSPQFGGLERRYNLIESLKGRGWPVVAYDLGDIPQMHGPANLANVQGLIKYRYAMESLRVMGYAATSFGEYEAAQPLNDAIDNYALNKAVPAVLAANLIDKATQFPDDTVSRGARPEWGGSYVGSWNVTRATKDIQVGALGFTSTHTPAVIDALVKAKQLPAGLAIPPSVGGQITAMNPKITFQSADKVIPADLKAMKAAKPNFRILLYQGPVELARLVAMDYPQFNVILCVSAEDEPPGIPVVVGNTFIIRVGHKGKNVGVVGVKATANPGKPFELRYQLVPLGPEFATPKAKEADHPILALMEAYTRELRDDNYLEKYGKVPHSVQAAVKAMPKFAKAKAGYVGSEACKKCHKTAFDIWTKTEHAQAYATLVTKAKNPSLREYDAECIVCHTVGFRYQGGFANAKDTPKLMNVSCESCHGPCEIHKNSPNDKAIHALINPWKAPKGETPKQKANRILKIEGMCRECHDSDNDVHWDFAKWDKRAKDKTNIIHTTPPEERQGSDDDE